MVKFDIDKLKEVRELRKRLQKEQQRIEPKPTRITKEITISANEKRSSKMKKYHRYIRLIRDNFPNLSYKEIQKQFSQRRQGSEVNISDAVWQNPSP